MNLSPVCQHVLGRGPEQRDRWMIADLDTDIGPDIQEISAFVETIDPGDGFRFLGGKGIGPHQRHVSEITQGEQRPPGVNDDLFPLQNPFGQRAAETLDGFSKVQGRNRNHFAKTS